MYRHYRRPPTIGYRKQDRFLWGAPLVGGLIGGLVGSTILNPYFYGPRPPYYPPYPPPYYPPYGGGYWY